MLGSVGHIKTILRTARMPLRRQSNEGIMVLLERGELFNTPNEWTGIHDRPLMLYCFRYIWLQETETMKYIMSLIKQEIQRESEQ